MSLTEDLYQTAYYIVKMHETRTGSRDMIAIPLNFRSITYHSHYPLLLRNLSIFNFYSLPIIFRSCSKFEISLCICIFEHNCLFISITLIPCSTISFFRLLSWYLVQTLIMREENIKPKIICSDHEAYIWNKHFCFTKSALLLWICWATSKKLWLLTIDAKITMNLLTWPWAFSPMSFSAKMKTKLNSVSRPTKLSSYCYLCFVFRQSIWYYSKKPQNPTAKI
mgnify:CR=1 FL=1